MNKQAKTFLLMLIGIFIILLFIYQIGSITIQLQDANTENLDDAFVNLGSPNTNYGTEDEFNGVWAEDPGYTEYWFYLKFNFSDIPDDATIQSAEFLAYIDNCEGVGGTHILSRADSDWDEGTLTWNNKPSIIEDLTLATQDTDDTWTNHSISNTTIQNILSDKNITLVMWVNATHQGGCYYRSKEHATASTRPYLNITYTSAFPNILIVYPQNNSNHTSPNVNINYTVSDLDLQACWYSNDTMTLNTTITCGENITSITWSEGWHNVTIWANDTDNNQNSSSVTFFVDTLPPTLSIIYPTPNLNISFNESINLNFSVSDSGVGLDSCWFSLDLGITNITIPSCLNTTFNSSFGAQIINLYANDSLNNLANVSQSFNVISQRKITQSISATIFIERIYIGVRGIADSLTIDNFVGRIATLFRTLGDSLTITTITDKLRSVEVRISQLIQFIISLFTKSILLPSNWIHSTNTTIQGQAIEEVRVPYEFNDNWEVNETATANFTNVSKVYSLPISCGDVRVEIDGVNMTGTVYVSNVLCDYNVTNNRTLQPTNTSLINITYTTLATTSSEGTWLAFNKRLNQNTSWRNTLTHSNPSTLNYTNVSVNITTDVFIVSGTESVKNATDIVLASTLTTSDGNFNWTDSLINSGDDNVFTIDYQTPKIELNETNFQETVAGQLFDIHNLTISVNSSRNITFVASNLSFNATSSFSNKLYKCTNGLDTCIEDITNRIDVAFSDVDGDGANDLVEWFITKLDRNQSYQLKSNLGVAVEITSTLEILNPPIRPFDAIEWKATITMYNPNAFETTVVEKYEFSLGARDIELDNVGKNLQFDPTGTLQPFITIVDKDDTVFTDSVRLSPGQTKTFIITYRTDSVTVATSTIFPDYFKVSERAEIIKILRIKNQAEDTVTEIEHRIPIDYGEDLLVCEGEEESGCDEDSNETLDEKSLVKGDYTLELDELEAGEVKHITLDYFVPTAIVEKQETGRRSIEGVLTNFKKLEILSVAPFTMNDLRYKEPDIKVDRIVNVFECRPTGVCDIPLQVDSSSIIKLGQTGVSERKVIYIWYVEENVTIEEEREKILDRILNYGKLHFLEKGTLLYYLFAWASEDQGDGILAISTGKIILISIGYSILPLLFLYLVYRRLFRKKPQKSPSDFQQTIKKEIK